MCGIAGVVDARNGRVDSDLLHRMCETLIHRGPDGEGTFVTGCTGLGMRRLSVIDLAGGSQPIFNEDQSAWVVFNGEIYNFKELRKELEKRGHHFRTDSDTEVIVHLYEDFGDNCVLKLRGMFAFALYDERRRRLLLARDRLGIKPLHYSKSGDRLFFASEIKAILATAPSLAETNPHALLQYFYFGYIPEPDTAFLHIQKLPPGHLLVYEDGEVRVRQYWEIPAYGTYSPACEEECLEQLDVRLSEAVRMELLADVPLGALLSGGIDSSTIVALMSRSASKPVKTFSVGFKHSDFDETPYARLVAQKFETEHHELILEPDIAEAIQTLASSLDEPFGDSSMLPTYFVCLMARKHVTVVLSGDGGDEMFAGYERYQGFLDNPRPQLPIWAGQLYRDQIYPRLPHWVYGRNYAYSHSLPWQERYLERISVVPMQRNYSMLSEDFLHSFSGVDPLLAFRRRLEVAPSGDPLERVLYLDTKTYLPGDILTKVDRMSMAASLEARVPMLDHVFVEWAASLNRNWKTRDGSKKFILTKFAERIGVPRAALHRPKQGFALPLLHWMRHELKDMVLSLLLEPRTLQRGYFNETGIRHLLDSFFCGQTDDYLAIWRLMMFELWQRNFLEACTMRDSRFLLTSSGHWEQDENLRKI